MHALNKTPKAKACQILRRYFNKKKLEEAGFTVRTLAQLAGVSPAFTSDILNGKKGLPLERLAHWAMILDIDFHDHAHLNHLLRERPAELTKVSRSYKLAPADQFPLLKNWYYLAMLNLTTCKDFDGDFAGRLGLSQPLIDLAVRELLRQGLLEERDGRLVKSKKTLRWASPRPSEEIRQFHSQMLTKAKNHLLEDTSQKALDQRLISGITFAGSQAKIEEAKKRLSKAMHEIAEFLAEEDSDEVFQLSVQLFPLSQKK